MRKSQGNERGEYDFELDLPKGEEAENELAEILEEGCIEVKRDLMVAETGNIAIEYECRGSPSGIATTKADWWAEYLDGDGYEGRVIILLQVKRLRRLLYSLREANLLRTTVGGDDKESKLALLTPEDLVAPIYDSEKGQN